MRNRILVLALVSCLLLLTSVTVLAAEGDPMPCTGENVSGMVVEVNTTTGTVTIDTGEGALCAVTLSPGTYSHPVVALLGKYFDDISPDVLVSALDALHGCALEDPSTMTWSWVSCDTLGAVAVTVSGTNPDGSFAATVDGTDQGISVQVEDPEEIANLNGSLAALLVNWQLGEGGAVLEAGDQIAALHEEGMGFGVLVKLFAIASESQEACMLMGATETDVCGVSVDELVSAFRDQGLGMGELFKLYGKPSILGVGHVKQQLREDKGKPPWAGPSGAADEDTTDDGSVPGSEEGPNKKDKTNPPGNPNKPPKPDKGKGKNK